MRACWSVLVLGAVMSLEAAAQPVDDRLVVEVPPEIVLGIRAEMRQHMDTLDDLMVALAVADFAAAADIAEVRMTVGHRMWERMRDAGASPDEIRELRERMEAAEIGPGSRRGAGMGGGGGYGRYVPDDFRAMGMAFHQAAADFAVVARSVDDPPTAEDYAQVLEALQVVTSSCRGCHATWRFD